VFDIGFWELALIGVIALLVIGPERLPGVARNVGQWVGQARRYVAHVKRDIERELHAEEVRQLLDKPEGLDDLRSIARETASVFDETRRELDATAQELRNPAIAATPPAGAAAAGASGTPRVAHHAVEDDPFASAGGDAASGAVPARPSAADPMHDDARPARQEKR